MSVTITIRPGEAGTVDAGNERPEKPKKPVIMAAAPPVLLAVGALPSTSGA
jgi:hypothetical protein